MILDYLKDRFNCEYLILRFGYPSHFAGTNNCGIEQNQPHPLIIVYNICLLIYIAKKLVVVVVNFCISCKTTLQTSRFWSAC